MKVQIVSDIHLEFRKTFDSLFVPSAPILCLLGDICICANDAEYKKFVSFIQWCSSKYQCVIHITGNHEYYSTYANKRGIGNTMEAVHIKLRKLEKQIQNYKFLNNKMLSIKEGRKTYNFIGTTLWTFVEKNNREKFKNRMNDYSDIYVVNEEYKKAKKEKKDITNINPIRKYHPNDMVKIHKRNIGFIKRCIKSIGKRNNVNILLTHHKPIADSTPDEYTQAYEVDLPALGLLKKPIHFAFHGHTHKPYNKIINGVVCMSNPKGYANQRTRFNPKLVVDLN